MWTSPNRFEWTGPLEYCMGLSSKDKKNRNQIKDWLIFSKFACFQAFMSALTAWCNISTLQMTESLEILESILYRKCGNIQVSEHQNRKLLLPSSWKVRLTETSRIPDDGFLWSFEIKLRKNGVPMVCVFAAFILVFTSAEVLFSFVSEKAMLFKKKTEWHEEVK